MNELISMEEAMRRISKFSIDKIEYPLNFKLREFPIQILDVKIYEESKVSCFITVEKISKTMHLFISGKPDAFLRQLITSALNKERRPFIGIIEIGGLEDLSEAAIIAGSLIDKDIRIDSKYEWYTIENKKLKIQIKNLAKDIRKNHYKLKDGN